MGSFCEFGDGRQDSAGSGRNGQVWAGGGGFLSQELEWGAAGGGTFCSAGWVRLEIRSCWRVGFVWRKWGGNVARCCALGSFCENRSDVARKWLGGAELAGDRVGCNVAIGVVAHYGPPYRGAVVRGRDACGATVGRKCGILMRDEGRSFLFFGLGGVRDERAVCASNVGD
jgi:hypothetical protein